MDRMTNIASRPTLLVGSVALGNAEEVLLTAGALLGGSLRAVPDGETGERIEWYMWQEQVMEQAPFLKKGNAELFGLHRYSVQGDLTNASFGKLGYADAAIASYEIFKRLRAEGKLPPGIRFQVSLPPPIAPLSAMIDPDDYHSVEPLYERAMRSEVEAICAAIPVGELAIQWDLAQEIAVLEGLLMLDNRVLFPDPLNDMLRRIEMLASWVPADAALGFHLCYGDADHKHWMEPKDTRVMVDFANAIFETVARQIDWLHIPVPRDRDDDSYFQPLADLKLPSGTQLYLGLVHHTDGMEGGVRRLAAAQRYVTDFGIATECGLGRRPPETIPTVMKLMEQLARD